MLTRDTFENKDNGGSDMQIKYTSIIDDSHSDDGYDVDVDIEDYIDDDMNEYEIYEIAFKNLSFEK